MWGGGEGGELRGWWGGRGAEGGGGGGILDSIFSYLIFSYVNLSPPVIGNFCLSVIIHSPLSVMLRVFFTILGVCHYGFSKFKWPCH